MVISYGQVIDEVEVIVDKLFLKGSVETFDTTMIVGALWIGKKARYPLFVSDRHQNPLPCGSYLILKESCGSEDTFHKLWKNIGGIIHQCHHES